MNVEVLLTELIRNNVKLSVQEDKLLCQFPESGIHSDLLDLLKTHKEAIKELIKGTKRPGRKPSIIKRQNDDESRQLSYAQQRLWTLDQIEGSAHYNISNALLLKGNLDTDLFQRAFNTILERHEILRTTYDLDENGEVCQIIQPAEPLSIFEEDLSGLSEEEQNSRIKQIQSEEPKLTFDLRKDVLLRVKLIRIKNDAFVVLVTMHHIATDGWSIGILIKEFSTLYTAFSRGEKNPLADLEIQYSDYARWQQGWLKNETLAELKNYWLGQLEHLPPVHSLPLDHIRPKIQTFKGNTIYSKIDRKALNELKNICDKEGATLFAGLHAVFTVLLGRYSNESDIVVGTAIANREQSAVENLIGFFVNMLVLRNQLTQHISFVELIRQSRQILLDAYSHQQMPFDMLVSELQQQRNPGHSSLFQIMLILQNNEKSEIKLPELSLNQMDQSKPFAMYDLSLIIDESNNGLSLGWEYNTDIFDLSTIQSMSGHFERLLQSMIASPQIEVSRANMISDEERNRVLVDFNHTEQIFPKERTIIDLFEEQVTATPEHLAVSYEDRSYTYRALDQVSNQLAAYLKDRYAVEPDDLIGIRLERSEEILLSVISILKSGGAYVPIGTGYPEDRIAYIIKDAGIKVLISEEELSGFFSVQGKYSKAPLSVKPSAGDLAYCIYTSGSTGQPKGVLNQHDGLFNRLVWMKAYLNVTNQDVFLQKTAYTFDVSVWELLLPVICGAQLVFAIPEGHKDPFYLQHIIEEKKVTIIHFVPSMLNIFLNNLEHTACTSLKHIVCSGEALPVKVVAECKQKLSSRIHNLYGPTEAAIDVTAADLTNIDTDMNGVTIGYPIANTSIYIVNDAMVLQPAGLSGELLIGGVQVARGYLNKPQLSEEKFIENPFKKGDRLYKTGDMAKWNSDGSIVYLGRRDSQVKIRGHRIELGEITTQLLSKPSVREAVVSVTRKGGLDQELVAYIVSDIAEDVSALRKFLAGRIPDYEIPAYFIQLPALPLSANGKVDEKALPDPGTNTLKGDTAYVAPRNENEQKLIEIFARELNIAPSEIGINDNFFDLGANSLKLIKILNEIKAVFKDEFKTDIKPVLLFQYTNINDLMSVLEESSKQELAEDETSVSTDMDDMIALF